MTVEGVELARSVDGGTGHSEGNRNCHTDIL